MNASLAAASPCGAPSASDDAIILRLWRDGCDTAEIARRLGRSEAQVANRLAQLRDMTPTQVELARARRERLARMEAAAARHAATRPELAPAPPAMPRVGAAAVRRRPGRGEGVSVPRIQEAVCIRFGVALADLVSPLRLAPLVRVRRVAIYLARELTPLSLAKIGRFFGDRDHSTILVSHRRIADRLKAEAALRAAVAELRAELTGSVAQPGAGSGAQTKAGSVAQP